MTAPQWGPAPGTGIRPVWWGPAPARWSWPQWGPAPGTGIRSISLSTTLLSSVASMGSGPGDRNQDSDRTKRLLAAYKPQWGPAPGTGIRYGRPCRAEPRLLASMGSGPGDRNQNLVGGGVVGDPVVASMGSGPGDRNQAVLVGDVESPDQLASMGSGPGDRNQGSRKNGPATWEYTGPREGWQRGGLIRRRSCHVMVAKRGADLRASAPRASTQYRTARNDHTTCGPVAGRRRGRPRVRTAAGACSGPRSIWTTLSS